MKRFICVMILCAVLCSICGSAFTAEDVAQENNEVTATRTEKIDNVEYCLKNSINQITGEQRVVLESESSLVINEVNGSDYVITKIEKDADGNLIPESTQVYYGTYSNCDESSETPKALPQ